MFVDKSLESALNIALFSPEENHSQNNWMKVIHFLVLSRNEQYFLNEDVSRLLKSKNQGK